ncbi:MAG: amino acid adenylation domain-containing protein [Aliivibrio sp.]|uniref:amino acid adenylation domain-containing protein n=1 Tax=Aliivibrio sp. TaxID=1872443 RepID=UPI001A3CE2CD|nr:amino acid adenylation domain-containing protein [Aliivibrio sp.]
MTVSNMVNKLLPSVLWRNTDIYQSRKAIVCTGSTTSYHSLKRQSSYINALLAEYGIGRGHTVGIMLNRGHALVPAMLGCWSVGATFFPLDPTYPLGRLEQYTTLTNPSLIITDKETRILAEKLKCKVIEIDDEVLRRWEQICSFEIPLPNDLAYILFTSGSTGAPKGVKISHESLANFMESIAKRLSLTERDVSLAHSTVCFDVSILELLLPLYCGGIVLITTANQSSDPAEIAKLLEEATFIHATPSYLQIMVATGWKPHNRLTVLSGAEAIRPSLVKCLKNAKAVWNLYGPTEATVYASSYKIEENDTIIPIGLPFNNVSFHVLDDNHEPCKNGGLYIGGKGLCVGYCNEDESRFVNYPVSNERLYQTGDMVRMLPSGDIEWLGRSGSELKVRGNRVAPKEIETALEEIDVINLSIVILSEFEERQYEALTAYLITNQSISKREIVEKLTQKLPQYMIPECYILIDEFPITPNGKVDPLMLPKPCRNNILKNSDEKPDELEIEPSSELIMMVCDVFSQVANMSSFSATERFEDSGINSISIIIAAQKLSDKLGWKVTSEEIRNAQSPIDLARKITS